jgi:ParB/RepB/Spo0J family partition protein
MTEARVVQDLPVAHVRSAVNDRQRFDEQALMDLAWSIKTNGLAQPITVRPAADGGWIIVAGERRFRAMTEVLGLETVPCLVQALDDEAAAALMLCENCARVDLNPLEEAQAYASRQAQFGWTVSRLADVAGVPQERVVKRLALLELRDEIQHLVRHDGLPLGHAEALCGLDRNRQLSALRIVQASQRPMPLPTFQGVCADLRAEQDQDTLFHLEASLLAVVAGGGGAYAGAKATPVTWLSGSIGEKKYAIPSSLLDSQATSVRHVQRITHECCNFCHSTDGWCLAAKYSSNIRCTKMYPPPTFRRKKPRHNYRHVCAELI